MGQRTCAWHRINVPPDIGNRAFVFGALGLWLGISSSLSERASWLMPVVGPAVAISMINRIRGGLAAIGPR